MKSLLVGLLLSLLLLATPAQAQHRLHRRAPYRRGHARFRAYPRPRYYHAAPYRYYGGRAYYRPRPYYGPRYYRPRPRYYRPPAVLVRP